MLCQNCGKNQVNFRYTQVINGVKKEIALCSKCAKELGLEGLDFSMPINFSSLLGDFLNEYAEGAFLPSFETKKVLQCKKCGTTFDEFVNSGELGCSNCYNIFADRISPVLRNLHGSSKHTGRGSKESIENNKHKNIEIEKENQTKTKSKKETEIENLQKDLQKAIKDERYEEAAKIRDKIKEVSNRKDK